MSSMCVCVGNIVQLTSDLTAVVAVNAGGGYEAGNGIEITDNLINVKIDPTDQILSASEDGLKAEVGRASEKDFGLVRAWVDDDGYICISTQDWVAFENTLTDGELTIRGSTDAQLENGKLTIN